MQGNSLASKRRLVGLIIPAILAALTAWSCRGGYSGPVASVSIGTTKSEVNSLVLIAQEQGYFAKNGLDVTHEIYPSGAAALEGVSNHEIDMATGSEFAFVRRVLSQQDVRAITVITRSSIEYLVGRVDRGINSVADLKGKTIGVPLGSRPEFALDRFLYFRGIDASEVTLVDVPVDQSVEALASGQVDAVAAWQPYVDQIRNRMGAQVVSWSTQADQPSYTLLMSSAEWIGENQDVVVRFLRALVEAERYVAANPEAVRTLVQERSNYSKEYVVSVWPNYSFSILLDQALVVAMEDQARWMIGKNLSSAQETPNFVNHIFFDGLETVKPEAVNIIR